MGEVFGKTYVTPQFSTSPFSLLPSLPLKKINSELYSLLSGINDYNVLTPDNKDQSISMLLNALLGIYFILFDNLDHTSVCLVWLTTFCFY